MISNEKRVLRALVKLGGTATGDEIAQLLGPSWDGKRVGQVMSWLVPAESSDSLQESTAPRVSTHGGADICAQVRDAAGTHRDTMVPHRKV